jgi:hypothetical protein
MDELKQIEAIAKILDQKTVKHDEFVAVFNELIGFVKDIKSGNEVERATLDDLADRVDRELNKLETLTATELESIRKYVLTIKNGVDGRDGKDGLDGIGINGKDGKDGSPDTPVIIRDKIETLKNDDRLDWTSIRGVIGTHKGTTPPEDKDMIWLDTNAINYPTSLK